MFTNSPRIFNNKKLSITGENIKRDPTFDLPYTLTKRK